MMFPIRKLLAVFFALWLPFSAVAAAMMPLCAHEGAKQARVADIAHHGCEQHQDAPDQAAGSDDAAAGNCSHCGLCVFSATPWLPSAPASLEIAGVSAASEGFIPALDSLSFPPEDRPPLSAA